MLPWYSGKDQTSSEPLKENCNCFYQQCHSHKKRLYSEQEDKERGSVYSAGLNLCKELFNGKEIHGRLPPIYKIDPTMARSPFQTPHPVHFLSVRWCRREVLLGVNIIWLEERNTIGGKRRDGGSSFWHFWHDNNPVNGALAIKITGALAKTAQSTPW
jgi:hypothetical protein